MENPQQPAGCIWASTSNKIFNFLSSFIDKAYAAPYCREGKVFDSKTSTSKSITIKKIPTLDQAIVEFKSYQRGDWVKDRSSCKDTGMYIECTYYPGEWEYINSTTALSEQFWIYGGWDAGDSGWVYDIPVLTHHREWCNDGYGVGFGSYDSGHHNRKKISLTKKGNQDFILSPYFNDCGQKATQIRSTVIEPKGRAPATLKASIDGQTATNANIKLTRTCPTLTNRFTLSISPSSGNGEFYDSAYNGTYNDSAAFMNGNTWNTANKQSATTTYTYTVKCFGYGTEISSASSNVTLSPNGQLPPPPPTCPSGTTYNSTTNTCDSTSTDEEVVGTATSTVDVTPVPPKCTDPNTGFQIDCPNVFVTVANYNSPVGQNLTINWNTDGETCSVKNNDNSYTFKTGIANKTYTFDKNNLNHAFLNTTHIANGADANSQALAFNIECSAPNKASGIAATMVQTYIPTIASITGPDAGGGLTFACGRDYDTVLVTRDGTTITGSSKDYQQNQTESFPTTIGNAETGMYAITCKSQTVAENISTKTKDYKALALTGNITGNQGGTATNAKTDESKFTSLAYAVANADSVSVSQEVRGFNNTTTNSGNGVAAKYKLTAPSSVVNLDSTQSPTVEKGITWMITAKQGAYTKTLSLNIDNDTNPGTQGPVVTPNGGDNVTITFTCKNSLSYKVFNDSVSTVNPIASGPTDNFDSFTKTINYTVTASDPNAKNASIRVVCEGVDGDSSGSTDTPIPSRVEPKVTTFRVYPEQVLCKYGGKVTVNYTVQSPKNCRLQASAVENTTCTTQDSVEACNKKKDRAQSISTINANLSNSTTNSDNENAVETRSYSSSPLDVKYSTKFKLVCDIPLQTGSVKTEKTVESVCQGEN
jgi:hypothetical protein